MTDCIDISNHTRLLTAQDVANLRAAGIRRVIVGLQFPRPPFPPGNAHLQLPVLIAGGMPEIECYAESQRVQDVWANVAPFAASIQRVWQAAEEDFVSEAYLDAAFAFIDALGLPRRAGLYTGAWWANPRPWLQKYTDRDGWFADYSGALTMPAGFTKCAIWQHAGTSTFAGVSNVDLNIIQEEEDEMALTQDQFNGLLKTAIGLPGGYQDVMEQYVSNLNLRLITVEDALDSGAHVDTALRADVDAIKAKLAAISAAAGG